MRAEYGREGGGRGREGENSRTAVLWQVLNAARVHWGYFTHVCEGTSEGTKSGTRSGQSHESHEG